MYDTPMSLDAYAEVLTSAPGLDTAAAQAASERNGMLTKPPGALGRMEDLAIWYCSWRGDARAEPLHPQVIIFAGNHGVTAQGVSAFPAEVTTQMVMNFEAGGAAINQICRSVGAKLSVHALDLDTPTADFTQADAMDEAACLAALSSGWEAVADDTDLLVLGEMGIGNTTSAAAIYTALWGGDAEDWVGRGTGVDDAGVARKAAAVRAGVARLSDRSPMAVLRCLGGREIAAMAGAMIRARAAGVPVILDGFIACAAASVLHGIAPRALDHAVAGHVSAEGAHGAVLEKLGKTPILSLDMRLGEGSGGAAAISVLRIATACHAGMATFGEAGVSEG